MSDGPIQKFEEQKREIEKRTLERIQESARVLDDTEKCGIATAQQLVGQGDQLKKIDKDLDTINNLLEESQTNINGIKSAFGGFKKRLFGKKNKIDVNPIEAKNDLQKSNAAESGLQENVARPNNWPQSGTSTCQKSVSEPKGTDFDSQFGDHMNDVSASIFRLKGLAGDMGKEFDLQNDLLKRIDDKTDKSTVRIEEQNKQMRKLM